LYWLLDSRPAIWIIKSNSGIWYSNTNYKANKMASNLPLCRFPWSNIQ
jgi:hypothetical protein